MNARNLTAIVLAAALAGCGGRAIVPQAASADLVDSAAISRTIAAPAGAGRTTAYAYVYADPSGTPLAGESVRLYPWRPCVKTSRTTRSCPSPVASTTTNASGEFVLENVANGHYLLVIGDDDPADLVHPTIHDQVWLRGGRQRLVAPTLPVEPKDAPFTEPVPRLEKSGNYRITTLTKWETLCAQGFDAQRAQRELPAYVSDEWLVENTRALEAYQASKFRHASEYDLTIIASYSGYDVGGTGCSSMIAAFVSLIGKSATATASMLDPAVLWSGATWYLADPKKNYSGYGEALFELDPRAYRGGASWP